ncbi:hypothetical protein [Corynebacterium xerosis]|uniref:Uncharacterized protein n=1 Tax=Corynebacterium xerosis TaxID=1725 RepID=A0ABV3UV98_9CORY
MTTDHTTPPRIARALEWDPADATLASGEAALARIVHALDADLGALDGAELEDLTKHVAQRAIATAEAERAGLRAMGIGGEPAF